MQRRGTIDAALDRLVDRPLRQLDPPVLAGLRLGAYELLFADGTPDHAAVDQAVELVKRAGAAHASGFVNAVLRRAARERDALVDSLLGDDSTPETAAVAHSAPLWLAQMWWRELGAEDARSLLAACNEPPEHAFRVNTLRTDPDAVLSKLRDAGVEAHAMPGAMGPWRRRRWSSSRGGRATSLPELVAAGELTPQSRGSAAVVELLDPAARRARARPLRRAGDQDRPDRGADGRPRRGDLGRERPRAGEPKWRARPSAWACAASP